MKILHISDLHYLNNYDAGTDSCSYQSALQKMISPLTKLDNCLDRLGESELQGLSGVLISGDICDGGKDEDYLALRTALAARFPEIPVIVTLGNHDDSAAFRGGWLGEDPISGPWHHIERIGDLSIIALDNSDPDNYPNGIIDSERCEWLRQALLSEKGRIRILMFHHHLIPEQAVFPSCRLDPEFDQILAAEPPDLILCGHTHQLYRSYYHGIPYRTAMSLSFIGLDSEHGVTLMENCGFSLYQFEKGACVNECHEICGMNQILGEVVF